MVSTRRVSMEVSEDSEHFDAQDYENRCAVSARFPEQSHNSLGACAPNGKRQPGWLFAQNIGERESE